MRQGLKSLRRWTQGNVFVPPRCPSHLCLPLPLFVQIYHIWWLCFMAQGHNFYYGANFFHKSGAAALKLSGAVALMRWRGNFSWNNGALVHWRKDLKSGANYKMWCVPSTGVLSHSFASVSHPKFLFCFEAKQAKLGGQFRYFASKSFALFRFSFASKRNSGTP